MHWVPPFCGILLCSPMKGPPLELMFLLQLLRSEVLHLAFFFQFQTLLQLKALVCISRMPPVIGVVRVCPRRSPPWPRLAARASSRGRSKSRRVRAQSSVARDPENTQATAVDAVDTMEDGAVSNAQPPESTKESTTPLAKKPRLGGREEQPRYRRNLLLM